MEEQGSPKIPDGTPIEIGPLDYLEERACDWATVADTAIKAVGATGVLAGGVGALASGITASKKYRHEREQDRAQQTESPKVELPPGARRD